MTLQEYLAHRAAGEAVPALDLTTLAIELLGVSYCHCCSAAFQFVAETVSLPLCHALLLLSCKPSAP